MRTVHGVAICGGLLVGFIIQHALFENFSNTNPISALDKTQTRSQLWNSFGEPDLIKVAGTVQSVDWNARVLSVAVDTWEKNTIKTGLSPQVKIDEFISEMRDGVFYGTRRTLGTEAAVLEGKTVTLRVRTDGKRFATDQVTILSQ